MELQFKKLSNIENKEQFVRACFDFVVAKSSGQRVNLLLKFHKLFHNNLFAIWNDTSYAHCTTMNYLLRIMLVKSGRFKDSEIELKLSNT